MVIIPLKEAREKYAMQIRKIYLKFILIPRPRNFFSSPIFSSFFSFPFHVADNSQPVSRGREKEPVYGAKR